MGWPSYGNAFSGVDVIVPAAPTTDRHLSFRYELLDANNVHKGWLDEVMKALVANNSLADIKRTARITMLDNPDIDWLADRVKPFVTLNGDEHPQGVFLLSSPRRRYQSGVVVREIEAYDQGVVLRDDKAEDRYTVAAGVNYITEVGDLLASAGITETNLTATSKVLPASREWDPGTSKGRIIGDLLAAINYRSLYFDADGAAVAEPYLSPSEAAPAHLYATDETSLILPEVDEELDLFDVANKWVLYTSEPDLPPLTSSYTNSNPNSPTSTVRRGRTIVDHRQVEAADQATLDAKVQRLAFEASQVYTSVEFDTGIVADHGDADVIDFIHEGLGISARYVEHTWSFDLKAGAEMRHRIRRVVTV